MDLARRARRTNARRRGQDAQGMIEFALVLPVILFLIFFTIDGARLVYTYNALDSIARDGARTASLSTATSKDCSILSRVVAAGQGFPISTDPHSVYGDLEANANEGAANGPTLPAAGAGYVYIYPAVAPGPNPSPTNNCQNMAQTRPLSPGTVHDVEVQVKYGFQPLTPLLGNLLGNITVTAISVQQLEPCPSSC